MASLPQTHNPERATSPAPPQPDPHSGFPSGAAQITGSEIAASELGEHLSIVMASIEKTIDDLAAIDRDDTESLSPEGRHIYERSGREGLQQRLSALESERSQVAEHADNLRSQAGTPANPHPS